MRPRILAFANNSTNQSDYCIKLVAQMKFKSDDISETLDQYGEDRLVFFDVEVFPNLFIVVWKFEGEDTSHYDQSVPIRHRGYSNAKACWV